MSIDVSLDFIINLLLSDLVYIVKWTICLLNKLWLILIVVMRLMFFTTLSGCIGLWVRVINIFSVNQWVTLIWNCLVKWCSWRKDRLLIWIQLIIQIIKSSCFMEKSAIKHYIRGHHWGLFDFMDSLRGLEIMLQVLRSLGFKMIKWTMIMIMVLRRLVIPYKRYLVMIPILILLIAY